MRGGWDWRGVDNGYVSVLLSNMLGVFCPVVPLSHSADMSHDGTACAFSLRRFQAVVPVNLVARLSRSPLAVPSKPLAARGKSVM